MPEWGGWHVESSAVSRNGQRFFIVSRNRLNVRHCLVSRNPLPEEEREARRRLRARITPSTCRTSSSSPSWRCSSEGSTSTRLRRKSTRSAGFGACRHQGCGRREHSAGVAREAQLHHHHGESMPQLAAAAGALEESSAVSRNGQRFRRPIPHVESSILRIFGRFQKRPKIFHCFQKPSQSAGIRAG